jgi:hypothetical protein
MPMSSVCTPARGMQSLVFLAIAFLASSFASEAQAQVAPRISGTPATTVRVGYWYTFTPTVVDPDTAQRALRFSITNKPAWAQFNIYSGRLNGTATQGQWSNIQIRVTDGRSSASLPAFTITAGTPTTTPPPSSGGNVAPSISGTPATSVRVGTAYSFTPTARDPNGNPITFSIANRPAWATFNTSTGRLSGTPTSAQVGTYSNIVIRASDGRLGTSLPAFSIAVSEVANGSATLSWAPPTRNADGSALTNLAGYRIAYGTSSSALNRTIEVRNAGITSYVVENLSPATYYFAVRAFSASGTESSNSNVASKTIR